MARDSCPIASFVSKFVARFRAHRAWTVFGLRSTWTCKEFYSTLRVIRLGTGLLLRLLFKSIFREVSEKSKGKSQSHVLTSGRCFAFISFRLTAVVMHGETMYIDEFIPFVVPATMWWFGGECSACGICTTLKMFLIIVCSGGFVFGINAINAGHHHPEIVHDGDAVR